MRILLILLTINMLYVDSLVYKVHKENIEIDKCLRLAIDGDIDHYLEKDCDSLLDYYAD